MLSIVPALLRRHVGASLPLQSLLSAFECRSPASAFARAVHGPLPEYQVHLSILLSHDIFSVEEKYQFEPAINIARFAHGTTMREAHVHAPRMLNSPDLVLSLYTGDPAHLETLSTS